MNMQQVEVKTSAGVADGKLFGFNDGHKNPGVLVLTDIFGIRPAFDDLCERIANRGYTVLMPNIFYRAGRPPFFKFPVDLEDQETLDRMKEIRTPLDTEAILSDTAAYVEFLSKSEAVSEGKLGVVGFCLTGRWGLMLAAHAPERIGAAASFHGGGLATEDADSPHIQLPKVKAQLYFGHAQSDRSMPVESIERLDKALDEWGGQFGSDIYPAGHGWMIPGREVYNDEQAERGFEKLIELLDRSLLKSPATA